MVTSKSRDLDLSHLRVMVAEDNVVNQNVIKRMLMKLKIEAVIVGDGRQAVEKARDKYDIIFMDCNMPIMVRIPVKIDTCLD